MSFFSIIINGTYSGLIRKDFFDILFYSKSIEIALFLDKFF